MAANPLPLVVIPGDAPVQITGSPQLERLAGRARVQLYDDLPDTAEEKLRRMQGAQILINSRSQAQWPGELLRQLPDLRFITTCSIGTDAVDLTAARECEIVVSNVPGRTAPVVAEHTLALMLAASKRLAFHTAEMKAGRWAWRSNVLLAGKLLGVIGTGAIGRQMIRLARAIGMQVQAWTFNPSPERAAELGVTFVDLDELLRTSDAVSLHVRLSPDTRHLIGARELELMKPGALLVNAARGDVIDTPALIEALNRGHLGGAALDVFDQEPLPPDHPLLHCEQVVLTPHNADQTPEGVDLLNSGAVDNVLAWLDGRPQNVVT